MEIRIISDTISVDELKEVAREFYRYMIKGVVDIEREVIAMGGEYHIDASTVLNQVGHRQENIWGFNINLDEEKDSVNWIEYVSLINIRPAQGNRSMQIEDEQIKSKIKEILLKKIS